MPLLGIPMYNFSNSFDEWIQSIFNANDFWEQIWLKVFVPYLHNKNVTKKYYLFLKKRNYLGVQKIICGYW